ncbi:MAG: hypothetical protein L0Y44_10565 [Phycisphaerales bacterium]|nr:hypothetical protein [Phycisphaerales bacterium]MCI0631080.1 hypothetical protein [Phycisphaerales bacterium]MCI0674423.1 hypothetical protein [Phycisphaerales bacterium]
MKCKPFGPTRRRTFIGAALGCAIATTLLAGYAAALQAPSAPTGAPSSDQNVQKMVPLTEQDAQKLGKVTLLFVQNAQGVSLDNGTMTLKGISPATIFFSDRPQRITGHLSTKEFVSLWGEGKDSFLSDPPNATLSIFDQGKVCDVVVELRNPKLSGEDFTYDVSVLDGEFPEKGGACSLFIDVVGMPLTPVSVAGVGRRCYRRAVW